MGELKRDTYKQTNLYLDEDTVLLATRKLQEITGSKRVLSTFVNHILEEFILEGNEKPESTIRQMARELTDKIRNDKLAQRKLITESGTLKTKDAERQALIEKETRAAVHKLKFKPDWLYDPHGLNFSHRRKELSDIVSVACRLDLQWKELMPIVADEVDSIGGQS